jgi:RNA polymerase sigma-70 factor (ECF subfamily)
MSLSPTDSGSTARSLLIGLRAGEDDAWNRVVVLYSPLVRHWCRRGGLPDQDVGDVSQEVFQAVAASVHRFRKSDPTDTFRGWLRRITQNKVHDHFRRRRREPAAVGGSEGRLRLADVPAAALETETDDEQPLVGELLTTALGRIRPEFHERTWQAFWRVVVDGRPAGDVGDELGMRPGTVRVAKSRVLQRLRAELGESQEPSPADSD